MRMWLISFLVIILAFSSIAQEKKNIFISEDLGITMDVPVSKESKNTITEIARFYLPATEGFAANVDIQKQKYNKSIQDYEKLSDKQIKALNLTIIRRKITGNESLRELRGKAQGKVLHWYGRAIKRENYVYLVLAVSLESQWEKQKAKLMKSVNSFKIQN